MSMSAELTRRERHGYHELLLSHFPAVRTCSFTIRSILCPCTYVTRSSCQKVHGLYCVHPPAVLPPTPPSHRGEPGSTSSVLLSLNDQHLQHPIPMPQSPTGVYTAYRHTRLHGSSSFRSSRGCTARFTEVYRTCTHSPYHPRYTLVVFAPTRHALGRIEPNCSSCCGLCDKIASTVRI